MKIGKRLQTIGDLVPLSSFPLDIGCDHALLSIYLVKKRNFSKVIASDNKQGPLEQAKSNALSYQVSSHIQFILSSGLDAYQEGVDTVTISGMGGQSINRIILEHQELLFSIDCFILSPNNYSVAVRQNLIKLGYYVAEEVVVEENHFYYPIMVFKRGKKFYSRKDIFLGPILKKKNDVLTKEYYQKILKEKEQLLKVLPFSYYQKKYKVKREIKWLRKVLGEMSFREDID